MASLFCGSAFGAALVAAGFHHPSLVISQLKSDDWHMAQVFLTATAGSAICYTIAERRGTARISPRSSSPLGLFGTYDGNVIGGALLGAGMALSGACPETLLTQAALGVRTGQYALLGAVIGGIVWNGILSKAVKSQRDKTGAEAQTSTLQAQMGISRAAMLGVFESTCLAAVAGSSMLLGAQSFYSILPGYAGGLLIGVAQLLSLVARRSMMGVSGSYEEAGGMFWWLFADRASKPAARDLPRSNIIFASGVFAGAWILARAFPSVIGPPVVEVAPALATVGGFLMIVGSRMAGGCTSGHGISGLSLLSSASAVTIGSAFAFGSLVVRLFH